MIFLFFLLFKGPERLATTRRVATSLVVPASDYLSLLVELSMLACGGAACCVFNLCLSLCVFIAAGGERIYFYATHSLLFLFCCCFFYVW